MMLFVALLGLVAVGTAQTPCGQTPISPSIPELEKLTGVERIVGGEDAVSGSWPWQIELQRDNRFICGGSLISPTHVITAGHCVAGRENRPTTFRVMLGGFDRSRTESFRVTAQVERIELHPRYSSQGTARNDIAIVILSAPVEYNDRIQPVCVPAEDSNVAVEPNTCIVTGWGRTSSTQPPANRLQQVQLPYVNSDPTCNRAFNGIIDNSMVCAGSSTKGGCFGDSGGPLVSKVDGAYHLYGIVSFGDSRCSGRPTVFARVAHFTDFIQEHANLP